MTIDEALRLLEEDLTELGMRADARRRRLHPDGIVTYSSEPEAQAVRVVLNDARTALLQLDELQTAAAVTPVCGKEFTAAEYLTFLAVCRLYSPIPNIELDSDWSGLKVAQIALRFGANDFGNRKPSSPTPEEEIRRIIRDAGFTPKRRDRLYRSLSLH